MNNLRTVSFNVIELLKSFGVDIAFGMPGTHMIELYRDIGRGGIRHIQCRNEQGASLMADGYFRATGRPGLCTIVTGPGVTNAATGIAQAYSDSSAMLVLSGATSVLSQGKGWGVVHELDDQSAITKTITGLSVMVHDSRELPEWIARAFAVFQSGRPRPVHISLPWDMLTHPETEAWHPRSTGTRPFINPESLDAAVELIKQATRPLIVLGGGAKNCSVSATRLAELIASPVVTSNAGKGIVAESHTLSIGCSLLCKASQTELAEADLVIIVGSLIAEGDHFLPHLPINGKIIRIDIDPHVLVSQYGADIPLLGDANHALSQLNQKITAAGVSGNIDQGNKRAERIRISNQNTMTESEKRHAKIWHAIREVIPEETIIMGDATQLVYTGSFALPMNHPNCWHYPGTYCSLGVALPMAIGAKIGADSRPVIAVAGDGGIMFTINEIATAVEEKLSLPVIVWNNNSLKEIADQMDRNHIDRVSVDPKSPDFVKLIESLGGTGVRPHSMAELQTSLVEAFSTEGPTFIEINEYATWVQNLI